MVWVLQLRKVLARDDPHHCVVTVDDNRMAQAHRAKVREDATERAAITHSEGREVDVRRKVGKRKPLQQRRQQQQQQDQDQGQGQRQAWEARPGRMDLCSAGQSAASLTSAVVSPMCATFWASDETERE